MQRPEGKEKLVDIKEMGFSLGSEMRPEREVGPDHVGADRPHEGSGILFQVLESH